MTSTTLADSFKLLLFADLAFAIWAFLKPWSNDEFDDGVAHGRQGGLRRRAVDSFFPPRLCEATILEECVSDHGHECVTMKALPGHIKNLCRNAPPVLFFINGCESTVGRGAGNEWKNRYDIFGLARAFLETGAYLLGNRWKVNDKGAANFAKAFYKEMLAEQPFGRAVREARKACKSSLADDFAWASYVYYGDPRIRFRKIM